MKFLMPAFVLFLGFLPANAQDLVEKVLIFNTCDLDDFESAEFRMIDLSTGEESIVLPLEAVAINQNSAYLISHSVVKGDYLFSGNTFYVPSSSSNIDTVKFSGIMLRTSHSLHSGYTDQPKYYACDSLANGTYSFMDPIGELEITMHISYGELLMEQERSQDNSLVEIFYKPSSGKVNELFYTDQSGALYQRIKIKYRNRKTIIIRGHTQYGNDRFVIPPDYPFDVRTYIEELPPQVAIE